MPERLTTQLEDGSIEKLRELAGGERKVGKFLSDVIAWLWEEKESLKAVPLAAHEIVPVQALEDIMHKIETVGRRMEELRETEKRAEETQRRLNKLEHDFSALDKLLSSYTEEQLDAMNESARQHDLVLIELMFNMLTDEEVEEYLARDDYGEYLGRRISELGKEKLEELKAKGRSKLRRKTKVKADAAEQSQKQ